MKSYLYFFNFEHRHSTYTILHYSPDRQKTSSVWQVIGDQATHLHTSHLPKGLDTLNQGHIHIKTVVNFILKCHSRGKGSFTLSIRTCDNM